MRGRLHASDLAFSPERALSTLRRTQCDCVTLDGTARRWALLDHARNGRHSVGVVRHETGPCANRIAAGAAGLSWGGSIADLLPQAATCQLFQQGLLGRGVCSPRDKLMS